MMRSFQVTLADHTVWYNLRTLCFATVGAVPTDGYCPDKICALDLSAESYTFDVADSNQKGLVGQTEFHRQTEGNYIYLGDWNVKGAQDGVVLDVMVEAK
jgi:hypothetical protein